MTSKHSGWAARSPSGSLAARGGFPARRCCTMTKPRGVLARALLVTAALGTVSGSAVILSAGPAAATASVGEDDVAVLPAAQAIAALQRGDRISYTILRYRVAA